MTGNPGPHLCTCGPDGEFESMKHFFMVEDEILKPVLDAVPSQVKKSKASCVLCQLSLHRGRGIIALPC